MIIRLPSVLRIAAVLVVSTVSVYARQAPGTNTQASRDQVSSTTAKPASISGRTVIIVNGQPLPVRRARVSLESNAMAKPPATDTDTDGRFRFDNLTPGSYRVVAEKPGFVPAARRVGDRPDAIDLIAGQPLTVDLLFERGAAFEGRVVSDVGDPAANVVVSALRFAPDPDGKRPVVRQTKTDDLGRFRLHTLIPDEYLIDAAPSLSPGNRPQAAGDPGVVHTYYPGSARAADAHPLTVSSGQEVRDLELSITGVPPSTVAGPVGGPPGQPTGGSRIAGAVTAASEGRPVRGAEVHLIRWEGGSGTQRYVGTDAQGHFEFPSLTAGSYQLSVRADGFVGLDYGQRRPTEPGKRIELTDAQPFDKADIALLRTSAIEGRVLDEFGDPAPGILVQIARVDFVAGKTRLMPIGGTNQTRPTDDLGQFRVFGLPPGDYYVEALSGPFANEDRAGFALTFYPGVTFARDAQPVHVDVGRDVSNLAVQLAASPLATVSGRIADATGQPAKATGLMLLQTYADDVRAFIIASVRSDDDGAFAFRNVPAGTYVLQGLQVSSGPTGGRAGLSFGSTPVTVGGANLSRVAVTVTAGAAARGHITFEGTVPPPPLNSIRINARAIDFVSGPAMGMGPPPSRVNDDGTFEATRNFGRGVLRVDAPAPWALKGITLNGVDVTDAVLDFRGKDIEGLEVVLTTRMASLTGKVLDQNQRVTDYNVIIFAEENTKWSFPSRYLTLARPNQEGIFTAQGLPPGTYLAVALTVVGTDWQDPQFLEKQRGLATRIVLGEGESRTLDLKLIRQ